MAKRRRQSYFDMNVERFGENFLVTKTPVDLQKDAKRRIFNDIIFGNIDYNKHGVYFTDPKFLEQLIVVAKNEEFNHQIKTDSLFQYMQGVNAEDRVRELASRERNIASVLCFLRNALEEVKYNGYNISPLIPLSQIIQYKAKTDFATEY